MYSKLMSSILSSSIWSEDSDTCKVWITLLAMQDREGYVFGSPAGIARIAALPLDVTQAALEKFQSPDPASGDLLRCPEREGRRMEQIEGGWRLFNGSFYRDLRDAEERREQNREAKRRERSKAQDAKAGQRPSANVSLSESPSDADAESPKKERARFEPPTLVEVEQFWNIERLAGNPSDFFQHFTEDDWRIKGGEKMRNWKRSARHWARREKPLRSLDPREKARADSTQRYLDANPQLRNP